MTAGESSGTAEPLSLKDTTYLPSGMQVAHFNNGLRVTGRGGEVVGLNVTSAPDDSGNRSAGVSVTPPARDEGTITLPSYTTYDALLALGATPLDMAKMGVSPECPYLDTAEAAASAYVSDPCSAEATWVDDEDAELRISDPQRVIDAIRPHDRSSSQSLLVTYKRGAIFANDCFSFDHDAVRGYACWERKWHDKDATYYYTTTKSKVTGAGKGFHALVRLRTTHNYRNGAWHIANYRPDTDKTTGSCITASLSLGYKGVSAGLSAPFCPERYDMSPPAPIGSDASSVRFTNSWYKWSGKYRTDRVAAANNTLRSNISTASGYGYYASYTWSW